MNSSEIIKYIIAIILIYLYASIPFAFLIAKSKNIDLRTFGSGNIGGSNLGRACGPKAFALTFVLDMSKGALTVLIAHYFHLNVYILFPFALLGHAFSIFLKFKGGKGIATCFGFALAYQFIPAIIAIISFLIILKITKYVSLSSILAILVFVIVVLLKHDYLLAFFTFIMDILVVILHKDNIKRIINGTERKITWM